MPEVAAAFVRVEVIQASNLGLCQLKAPHDFLHCHLVLERGPVRVQTNDGEDLRGVETIFAQGALSVLRKSVAS